MALLAGIVLASAASLAFEITLTRVFAISQGYHLSFLAISVALLGFGASGTALALRPLPERSRVPADLTRLALAFSVCLVGGYLVINCYPFDSYRVTLERVQLLYLALNYAALVVPFFLSGWILGLPLAALPQQTARAYAANLAGSGLGCLAGLGALAVFGETRAVFVAALFAALAAFAFSLNVHARLLRAVSVVLVAVSATLVLAPLPLPDLQISPYAGLSQTLRLPDARLVWRAGNAYSRVEVVASSAVRSAPGLSLAYRGAMPAQNALFQDAQAISPLTDAAPASLLDALPVTLAYRLRPQARVLMLNAGGGLEVLAALHGGARAVVAVQDNPLVAQAARQFAPQAFGDPRVDLVSQGTRSYAARSRDKFDLVQLALADSFHPSAAGAFSLSENYVYTRQALDGYLERLTDDGILVISRWLQLPPTEEARAGALAIAALQSRAANPSRNLLALRSFSTLLLLVKLTPFTAAEIQAAKSFAAERQYDWIAYPGMQAGETNRYNVLRDDEYARVYQQLLAPDRRARFVETYAYDITPPTDDRPFFFHFFKWEQTPEVLQLLGKLWQPFGGSGYLTLVVLLALSIVASGALILLPLVARRGPTAPAEKQPGGRDAVWLVYFASLGTGFLFVEVPLIQRFVLFLDYPVTAFATVLCTLLVASGLASSLSEHLPHHVMLVLLVLVILIEPLLLPGVFETLLGEPLPVRLLVSLLLLTPLGLLMGLPFPQGLAQLNRRAPSLVPLAWGINGCASVISSILATMGATTWGFAAVMLAGAGAYALAWATLGLCTRPRITARA